MSINDPVEIVFGEKRQAYYLRQGRETFYDENRALREWESAQEA